jgi:hypothetical protein
MVVGVAVALVWSLTAGATSASALPLPTFEPTDCPTATEPAPSTLPKEARCGFLVVPENRTKQNGHTIRLMVGIVPSVSLTPAPDTVVYLTGGPGGFPFGEAQNLIHLGFNRDRDLIIISQRGPLYTPPDPAPTCPEVDRAAQTAPGLPLDGALATRLNVDAAGACYQRLATAGLAEYSSSLPGRLTSSRRPASLLRPSCPASTSAAKPPAETARPDE